ncbi:thiamine-phosphate kinase [Chitinivibrio alkaliphilus]|uniref:Thiamine-monophosphate kinase n=1 Tax=Chitinivibrio alkaliphilus ACht1 TaxID=1313304 RepID=U7D8Q8_9BACT|nr:thiamine-phosphate kinase [Chitinivibrio alkaliphilus]ERP39315.1 thiamine monophosphate kinase [Chitinivibrio alkaliphilus ACht1]
MIDEKKVIDQISAQFADTGSAPFLQRIGDDCAVRSVDGGYHLYSADVLVENVHFSHSYMTLFEIGRKTAAVNISDIAAMGGIPDSLTIQLVCPPIENLADAIKELYSGIHELCETYQITLAGGDLSRGPCWVIACSIVGTQNTRVVYREGATIGDELWVTGTPGLSSLGFDILQRHGRIKAEKLAPHAVRAHVSPSPQVKAGQLLAACHDVHAMIDVSDGIAKEARLLSNSCGKGACIYVPSTIKKKLQHPESLQAPEHYFLSGGEDYELLFATAPGFIPPPEVSCMQIGHIIDTPGIFQIDGTPWQESPWDHFSGEA